MSKANKDIKKIVFDQIRAVEKVLRIWDPIGVITDVNDPEAPLDEYDSYAPVILGKLRSGASVEVIAQHLHGLTTKQMGLRGNLDHDRKIANQLVTWWTTYAPT